MISRHFLTKKFYQAAVEISKNTGKKLMVVGDPCRGAYFSFISRYFPNCKHGNVTIDLFGCSKCLRMDINDMEAWSQFESDSYVIIETGTISYSKDIGELLKEVKRISGGDFLSAGGTQGFLWENFLYKTYDRNLTYVTYPFDYRKDTCHKSKELVGKQILEIDFKKI